MVSNPAALPFPFSTLAQYGADLDALHLFDEDVPDLLPYATLVNARLVGDPELNALIGVYEWQREPLLFLIDGEHLHGDAHLRSIRRRLAMRGDAPYLGVLWPGRLQVYDISLDGEPVGKSRVPLGVPDEQTFIHLSNERPRPSGRRRWISDVVLKLLDESISDLVTDAGLSGEDAISLVGRALFTRFLGDRGLLPESLTRGDQSATARLFDSPSQAKATSEWLDRTFNGEFLPLKSGLIDELPEPAIQTLGNVLRRALGGQYYFEWEEDWAHLDFAHIPVGVLSQAYELFLRNHQSDRQRKEGGYYTPMGIAQVMVRAAFHALRTDAIAHQARILDPAAGAGVFLLNGFRQLVAERWRADGIRPDTSTLRKILYNQITGFDVNESALRFAALGLYLLAIELDPDPEPVEKLCFDNLRELAILQKVGDDGSLGSLGASVGDSHVGRYDLVIGNPPWASSTHLPEWALVVNRVAKIAESRLRREDKLRLLPNEVLDLPFVWRAMEWAKPGAQIVFALHARILFQQHEGMFEARRALFSAMDVTGVVNGAELRQTNVWPEVSAPFCLVFARNRPPEPGAGFRFVSPRVEQHLNRAGSFRIDSNNAPLVETRLVIEHPQVLKVLFRGGELDWELFERVSSRPLTTIREYWQERFGGTGNRLRYAGNGYQDLRVSTPLHNDGERGVPAGDMIHLRELTVDSMHSLLVDHDKLRNFGKLRLHRTRGRELYRAPILLVHKSPPATGGRIRVGVADKDLVFSETFYGYSALAHSKGDALVRFLALVIGSRPAFWHCFMTSGEFGFERDVLEKATVDSIPVPRFEDLDPDSLQLIDRCFDAVAQGDDESAWGEVDAWVARLYGLRESDLIVIDDTLRYNLPFADNRRNAQRSPNSEQIAAFCDALEAELAGWADDLGDAIGVRPHPLPFTSPWFLVHVQFGREAYATARNVPRWAEILNLADQMASTEVLLSASEDRSVWIARLAQARYWSRSQARVVARRIVWEHTDVLAGLGKV